MMRMPTHRLAALLLAVCIAGAGTARADVDWTRRVLKVEVTRADGGKELGSAVPLARNRMVTNCHVVRNAQSIRVFLYERSWTAHMETGDAYRDMCFIDVPGYEGKPMPMVEAGATRVGMKVVAVGFTSGRFRISEGRIKGLHTCPCDGGRVIQTSASFDRGASGGGLFDEQGRLVGVLTFRSQAGGDFHFALPVGWLRGLASNNLSTLQDDRGFWERSGKDSGYFLAACALGAKQDWRPLTELAGEWTRKEPDNPESWMALGRSQQGLGQYDTAAAAFQRALLLDSTHEEARWELQKLEFELDRNLLDIPGG